MTSPFVRRRHWPVVLVGVILLAGTAVTVSTQVRLPYYAATPGQVIEVSDFVVVENAETFTPAGDLYFLTVSQREVTPLEWLEAQFDDEVDLRDRDVVRPPGVSVEQRRRRGLDQQEEAKRQAIFVALTRLGFEPNISGGGALVASIVPDTAADGTLQVDDVVTSVDSEPVVVAQDLADALGARAPGDAVDLTVQRFNPDGEDETVAVSVTLGTNPDDAARAFLGVSLGTFEFRADFPVEVDIDSQNIGGPSSGLMYTLGIMNILTPDDLTNGRQVAGTGTIRLNGDVGPIGGVRQKVYAARRAGADYVLVPTQNFEDARTADGGEIEIVPVDTVDDALVFLESLG